MEALIRRRGESDDYRSQLGLVSRIHADFEQMAQLLTAEWQTAGNGGAAGDGEARGDSARIDRIALYIDDLDRCPPKRVVEVLEAVHLILAVPLFVVVIAVDPRWLLQALRLHYSQLLAPGQDGRDPDDEEEAWVSTPVHYLEKIIQVPFALRPLNSDSVASLVHGLLPIVAPADGQDGEIGEDGEAVREGDARSAASPTRSSAGDTTSGARGAPVGRGAPAKGTASAPAARATQSLNPRVLALTEAERDFAVQAASVLRTARAVKKFTNLYRLLRAGLDDHSGQLDRFLRDDRHDAPEYQAVLVMLAVVIRFPDQASTFLRSLGDLAPGAPATSRAFSACMQETGAYCDELAEFLRRISAAGSGWTCEPFRRWALEVSRYSFQTGQQVFARVGTRDR